MSWVLDFTEPDEPPKVEEGVNSRGTVNAINRDLGVDKPPVGVVDTWEFREEDWIVSDKPIAPPVGYSREEFNMYVERYLTYFRKTGDHPQPIRNELLPARADKTALERASRLINTDEFKRALISRGVNLKHWSDDPRKLQALGLLTDPLAPGTFESKLKKVGITSAIWDGWLADKEYEREFRNLTEKNFKKRQGEVNLALQGMALKPGARQLESIRYYNEVSGRHDPNRRQVMDLQTFTQGVIDIITREVKDDAVLMRIASQLSVLAGGSGAFSQGA